jgi:5-methylcytosine-specific restriction endonuclease McrA
MEKRYRDAAWLREQYHERGKTQRAMAEECDVSARTIRTYMRRFGIETRDLEGENHPLYGDERDEDVREQISETLEGREVSEEWRSKIADSLSGNTIPDDVRERISESLTGRTLSESTRRRMSRSSAGERNPNWRGGYSRYYGAEWALARDQVRKRDRICQHCGHDGTDRRLEVHHIVPVRLFREAEDVDVSRAHQLDNLVLLCNRCHGKADHGLLGLESDIERPGGSEAEK